MQFHYIASTQEGKIVERDAEANDVHAVLTLLAQEGLKPVSIRPLKGVGAMTDFFHGTVTVMDQIFISKYLALMLKIGTGLMEAITILIEDFTKPAVKGLLLEIRSALEKGNPFYTTFAKYPRIFSSVYINLVRAGEASGNLQRTFEELHVMLSKQKDLKDNIKGALMYPFILLVGAVLVLALIVTIGLPKIAKVFTEGGFEPPTFSRIVFQVGFFFQSYGLFILFAVIACALFLFFTYRSSLVAKRFVAGVVRDFPVVRDVVKKIALQRFTSILATLIRAGIPLTDALEITARAVGDLDIQESLERIVRDGLTKGLTLSQSFHREAGVFPVTVIGLIGISERAGHLGEALETLGEFYTKEIDVSLKSLVAFLEPIMLLCIGMIIGIIALSIIIPIYQLTTQF